MPALLPPSMQIGALPPGWSTLPPSAPAGVGGGVALPQAPSIIQTVIAVSTGAAQPASFSATIASTRAGSTLLAFIAGMAQGGTQNFPVPTNFTGAAGTGGSVAGTATIQGAVLQNNVGGITTVTWPTLTNWSSCVGFVVEVGGAPVTVELLSSGQSVVASGTSASPATFTPAQGAGVIIALGFCNSAQTASNGSTPAAQFTQTAANVSTNSQASVVNTSAVGIWTPAGTGSAPQPLYKVQGNAAGATAVGVAYVFIGSLGSAQMSLAALGGEVVVDQGAGYSAAVGGVQGWATGLTKPGGAGGGQ